MNDAVSPTTSAAVPNTAALAASSNDRFGVAARVDRIIPEPYSVVMTSTPRTPLSNSPRGDAASALFVRSADAFFVFAPDRDGDADRAPAVTPASTRWSAGSAA